MANATQAYRRSFAGSVGSGVKSIIGGGENKYYTLVHKVSSQYHKAGESQPIIVNEIEIGRDPKCQVRFDESFTTVSRRHAAIIRDGDKWKLIQLSQTNSTYLNGHKVQNEWYLQNGDEIQLSTNGPKLGFIIPEGKAAAVGSIGLSKRLSLFRQQALRPYKTAIGTVVGVLAMVCVVGGFLLFNTKKDLVATQGDLRREQEALEMAKNQWNKEKAQMQETMDELTKVNSDMSAKLEKSKKEITKIQGDLNKIREAATPIVSSSVDNAAIEKCLPYVYFICVVGFDITLPDGTSGFVECSKDIPGWSGTGFLLSDGRFVTARHVAEGWNFWRTGKGVDEFQQELNAIANNGGSVVAHFVCVSSSGSKFNCTSEQFTVDRSNDEHGTTEDGYKLSLAPIDGKDYAYMRTKIPGGLAFDTNLSTNLDRGVKLTVLGFPYGLGANSPRDINPIYGSAIVASKGVQDGIILTTDTNYESGNSGGPVFCTNSNGDLVTIGLVSAGAGRNLGMIVPISALR